MTLMILNLGNSGKPFLYTVKKGAGYRTLRDTPSTLYLVSYPLLEATRVCTASSALKRSSFLSI
jgi:hypothetical protein